MDNNMIKATNEYKRQSIITSSKEELTLMLYNGCIKFINDAVNAVDNKDYQSANYNIQRAGDIVTELICTLDMSYEISGNMKLLYEYINQKLLEGNIEKNTAHLKEALDLIKEFKVAWFHAMKSVKTGDNQNVV